MIFRTKNETDHNENNAISLVLSLFLYDDFFFCLFQILTIYIFVKRAGLLQTNYLNNFCQSFLAHFKNIICKVKVTDLFRIIKTSVAEGKFLDLFPQKQSKS